MLARFRSQLTFANVVSLMALFVALSGGAYALSVPKHSIGAAQLKNNAVTASKIKNGAVTSSKVKDHSLLAKDFQAGQLPAGPQGPPGPQGPTGVRGDTGIVGAGSRQVGNVNGIGCNTPTVVGSMTLTVPANSQIWTNGQGAIAVRASDITEAGLFLRLRDAADTTTLAVSVASWQGHLVMQDVAPLTTGGLMLAGTDPDTPANAFTAAPGTYILELMAWPNSGTCSSKPDFGWNQGGAMGYMLLR